MTIDTKSLGLGHVQRRSQFKLYAEIVLTPCVPAELCQ